MKNWRRNTLALVEVVWNCLDYEGPLNGLEKCSVICLPNFLKFYMVWCEMISIYGVVVIWTTKHRGDRTHFWFRLAWRWLLRVACTKLIRGCTDASHKPSTSTSSRLPSAWRLLPLPPTSTCHHRQCCSLPSTLNRQRVVSLKLIHP